MNEPTTQQVTVHCPDGDSETDLDIPTLRRLADVAEMIGHPITTNCPKGFARDFVLEHVAYGGTIKIRGNQGGDTIRLALCPMCRISVIMDLGTVTA